MRLNDQGKKTKARRPRQKCLGDPLLLTIHIIQPCHQLICRSSVTMELQ